MRQFKECNLTVELECVPFLCLLCISILLPLDNKQEKNDIKIPHFSYLD